MELIDISFRKFNIKDINRIVEIYNSNIDFLNAHLDVNSIDSDFIINDFNDMKIMGFNKQIIPILLKYLVSSII